MKYVIILLLSLSLPATALVSTMPKNTIGLQKTPIPNKHEQKTEELRKIIQQKTGYHVCDPNEELKMPTFY